MNNMIRLDRCNVTNMTNNIAWSLQLAYVLSAGWWLGGGPSTQRMSSRATRWICSMPWAPGSLMEYSISFSRFHLPVRWVQVVLLCFSAANTKIYKLILFACFLSLVYWKCTQMACPISSLFGVQQIWEKIQWSAIFKRQYNLIELSNMPCMNIFWSSKY